jgi:hypothetical protein
VIQINEISVHQKFRFLFGGEGDILKDRALEYLNTQYFHAFLHLFSAALIGSFIYLFCLHWLVFSHFLEMHIIKTLVMPIFFPEKSINSACLAGENAGAT